MIKIENLSKYYYGSSAVTCALHRLNLELKIGEFVAITGESGSGKTTLLNVISGLDTYEDGEMYINNKPTSYFDNDDWEKYRKNEVAFIFQNYNLIDSYTVLENVMVAFIINDLPHKEALAKAKELLKIVGLEGHYRQKASKLSGGQKQRLAIARALAKNTKIIVADEPTGNLDSENGKMIMQLLKKISKDKLIIVVTHNQEEADPYVTRKIRLHEGEIVLDEQRNAKIIEPEGEEVSENSHTFKQAFSLFKLNVLAQPRKSILLTLLIFGLTLALMSFLGTFVANFDEASTKELTDNIFVNHDDRRLLVGTNSDKPVNDELLEKAKVKYVDEIEPYDYITDINYFRSTDYKYVILSGENNDNPITPPVFVDNSGIKFTNFSHFMRSSYCLSESSLSAGRLPNDSMEMVVYSDDISLLNTTETVYFCATKVWGDTNYIKYDIKIVGLLKEPTEQTYFSVSLCETLNIGIYSDNYSFLYRTNYKNNRLEVNCIYLDPNLTGNMISLPDTKYKGILAEYQKNSIFNELYVIGKLFNQNVSFQTEYQFDLSGASKNSNFAVGLSKDLFDKIIATHNQVGYNQFAIFLDDYAYTDDVMNALAKNDFVSLSCYRASLTTVNNSKLMIRFITLTISIIALFLLSIVEIALCYSILKIKKNDFIIFKALGITKATINKVNYIETLFYGLISYILVVVLCVVVKYTTNNEYLLNIFKFIRVYHYLILLMFVIISMFIAAYRFNKYLDKNTKIVKLKEE